MKLKRCLAALAALALWAAPVCAAEAFRPGEPVMPLSQVKAGMKGCGRTVFQGNKVQNFPIEVLGVISRKERPSKLILIRASGPDIEKAGGLASGMSGSPIYVDGRLIGAFSFGWDYGDPKMGLVTPIEDMIRLFDYPGAAPVFPKARPVRVKRERTPLDQQFDELYLRYSSKKDASDESVGEAGAAKAFVGVSGLSRRAMKGLENRLGVRAVESGAGDNHAVSGAAPRMSPGDSIAALLAWGDVTVDANGTLTAIDRDGRFIAFGHSFKNWGAVAYPIAKASVYGVVNSIESPFKITSAENIIGTVTQDRAEGIAGFFGKYPPGVSVRLDIEDLDAGRSVVRRFQMINDEHVAAVLLPELLTGVIDRELGRQTGGTIRYSLTISGSGIPDRWTQSDVVVADEDVTASAVTPMLDVIERVLKNPYQSLGIPGLRIRVSATTEKHRLIIERVRVDRSRVVPGQEIRVNVSLRPWRQQVQTQTFRLRVPADAEPGNYVVTVRAGGASGFDGTEGGVVSDRSLTSFPQFLHELQSGERGCEVVLELAGQDDSGSGSEFPGEARRRKIREGTMKIFRSDYAVEGNLQAQLTILPKKGAPSSAEI